MYFPQNITQSQFEGACVFLLSSHILRSDPRGPTHCRALNHPHCYQKPVDPSSLSLNLSRWILLISQGANNLYHPAHLFGQNKKSSNQRTFTNYPLSRVNFNQQNNNKKRGLSLLMLTCASGKA